MRRNVAAVLAIVVLTTSTLTALTWTPVVAQGTPPELGDTILEDALTGPSVVGLYTCPTGRVTRQFANDGLTIVASGGCQTPEGFPGSGVDVGNRLSMADGELRIEFRQLTGLDRTQIQVQLRTSSGPAGFSGYSAILNPTRGTAQLGVSVNSLPGTPAYKQLGQQNDLAMLLKPDDWNTLALRVQGPNLWMFVNDQLVLAASDSSLDAGNANANVSRTGQPNASDTHEISAVLRNLRVSALSGSEQARSPVYTPPPPVVTASHVPCSLPTALPDDIRLNAPAADIDAKIATLAGAWEGTWDEEGENPLPSRIYVEQLDGSKATAVYTWGNNRGTTAGWNRSVVDIDPEGKFGAGPATRRFSFWVTSDNSLAGTLVTPQFTSKITLTRCPSL